MTCLKVSLCSRAQNLSLKRLACCLGLGIRQHRHTSNASPTTTMRLPHAAAGVHQVKLLFAYTFAFARSELLRHRKCACIVAGFKRSSHCSRACRSRKQLANPQRSYCRMFVASWSPRRCLRSWVRQDLVRTLQQHQPATQSITTELICKCTSTC
jgi:hypothetical protein